ncbi:mobilization protein [Salmonella enterica subsp. enterica]|nr:mobilization protein [Salmonella enterica subsp. enterica serovar Virchow]
MSKSEKRQKTALLPSVRCLPEEKEQIVASARSAGISTGEFLRCCALGRKITPRGDAQQIRELMKLGGLQKHLYTQMQSQMTPALSKQFSDVLIAIQKAIVGIDMGIDPFTQEK